MAVGVTLRQSSRIEVLVKEFIMLRPWHFRKFGSNFDVDAAEDIVSQGGDQAFPTVAFQTEVLGGANDAVGSNGVYSIEVDGVLANYVRATEVATLTGATPVVLTNSYYRMNRMQVLTAGSAVSSFNIICRHTGSATLAIINSNEGQTLKASYTVPASYAGYIDQWGASVSRSGQRTDAAAAVRLQVRKPGSVWRTKDANDIQNGMNFFRNLPEGDVNVTPGDDIRVRITGVNTDNLLAHAHFSISGTQPY